MKKHLLITALLFPAFSYAQTVMSIEKLYVTCRRNSVQEIYFYKKLENHLINFCKNYKFTITSKIPFTNTGGIIFMH
jgi:hypothetical protein